VDGQTRGPAAGNGADGASDGVGDVVEFEIEEYLESAVAQAMDDAVSSSVIELHADFEPAAESLKFVDEVQGRIGGRKVQRDDEPVGRGERRRCNGRSAVSLGGVHAFSLTVPRAVSVLVLEGEERGSTKLRDQCYRELRVFLPDSFQPDLADS